MRWMVMMALGLMVNTAVAAQKVAVVDMERAVFLSEAAKASIKVFEQDNQTEIDKLKSLESALREMNEKREKNADFMSDEERRKLAKDFEEKRSEFQFFAQNLQKSEQRWKREFFQTQLPNVEKLLKAIIKEGEYDVVLQAGAVVYASPQADLTKPLLERLNAGK
ncbi:hypothetical protein CHH28_11495 [Bacterioplanes sanyensis]|uniref:Molecular chaperone Skp n=1 Tax=Bacterioplanes sanyensis TaxID=1249553 RepID=A0A222FLK0_9GAMM|nr:OmpH family outer membrane protein [Bacterioplanes sanyensis]ASP39261.1 hypothetical protein CHH28_11495 [Bacterioplanes sanyensis]